LPAVYDGAVTLLWLLWMAVVVLVVVDMVLRYRRHVLSGRALAVWVFVVVVLPIAGVAVYVIVRVVSLARREPNLG
jgi:hypothetical protein